MASAAVTAFSPSRGPSAKPVRYLACLFVLQRVSATWVPRDGTTGHLALTSGQHNGRCSWHSGRFWVSVFRKHNHARPAGWLDGGHDLTGSNAVKICALVELTHNAALT